MAFIKKFDGNTDSTINLGDKNNPVRQSIEGYYLGTKNIPDSGYGVGKLHIFQTSSGVVGVWGKTNSNRLMTLDLTGKMTRLTFTGMGEKKKGKNPAYNYELEVDSSETIDVTGVNLNTSSEPDEDDSEEPEVNESSVPKKHPLQRTVGKPASVPSTESQNKIQAMLNARKTQTASA
jgi:hypothetical protein